MFYYKYKEIQKDYTTLSIIGDIILYDRVDNICYCGFKNELSLLAQHMECEVRKLEYDEIKDILNNCTHVKIINESIVNDIRNRYSVDDEMKLIKKALTNPNDIGYLQMQEYITNIKNIWNMTKKEMGLIQ